MARFHRKRRRQYWLPTLGSILGDGEEFSHRSYFRVGPQQPQHSNAISPFAGPGTSIQWFPILPDFTETQAIGGTAQPSTNLRDFVNGSDWFCKRIVGKLHLLAGGVATNTARTSAWANILVTAGFFVSRADQVPGGAGQANPDLPAQEFDPGDVDNQMDPWMWRKSWILRNPTTATSPFPSDSGVGCNMRYGSVADGPNVDVKSVRRITREHRLFFVSIVEGFDPDNLAVADVQTSQQKISGILDIRVLGHLAGPQKKGGTF